MSDELETNVEPFMPEVLARRLIEQYGDQAAIAEPFFIGLGATIEVTPAMDMADLQAGLSALG